MAARSNVAAVKRLLLVVVGLLAGLGALGAVEIHLRGLESERALRPYPSPSVGYVIDRVELGEAGDIVVLGDSVTDGGGLERGEAWPAQVAERLDRSVYNLSSVGWDTAQIAGAARDLLPEHELVVYAAFTNDVVPTRVIGHPPVYVGAVAPMGLEWADPWLPRSAAVRAYVGGRYTRDEPEFDDVDFFERAFADLVDAVEGELLVFVLVPHVLAAGTPEGSDRYGSEFWASRADTHARILAAAEAHGVPAASVFPYLVESGASDFTGIHEEDRIHPNAEGHALFAEAFVDVLDRYERGEPFREHGFEVVERTRKGKHPGGGKNRQR